jgi:hypothetical protein
MLERHTIGKFGALGVVQVNCNAGWWIRTGFYAWGSDGTPYDFEADGHTLGAVRRCGVGLPQSEVPADDLEAIRAIWSAYFDAAEENRRELRELDARIKAGEDILRAEWVDFKFWKPPVMRLN